MIRFALLLLLFLTSLLTVVKAFAYPLWITSILVDEFPWIFIFIALLLLGWGVVPQRMQLPGNVVCVLSILLLLYPPVSAWHIASSLPEELKRSFGTANSERLLPGFPFQFTRMITGINGQRVSDTTFVYSDLAPGLTLDFYPSQQQGPRPCVIVIHGGSWASGDSRQLPELNSVLAGKGYHVASINYRLAPRYQNPAPVEDVNAALDYLRAHHDELQIDPDQFVLLGRSAGAQIALLSAYTLHHEYIKGVISFYGPADMVWGYSIPSNPWIMDSRGVMEDFLGGTYEQVPHQYEASSPVLAVDPHSVPTLMIHGKKDVLVAYEHSTRLSRKLKEAGVRHYLLSLPWATHGCDYTLNGPGGQLSAYSIAYFLAQVTK